jgi:hypothetical protein
MSDEEDPLDDSPPTVEKLVSKWLSGEDITMNEAIIYPHANPETAWQAVIRIIQHDLSNEQVAVLAAGPVEDLLSWHGPQFIDRIEAEAQRNPFFSHILGGVWRQDMPDEIWNRIESARGWKVW